MNILKCRVQIGGHVIVVMNSSQYPMHCKTSNIRCTIVGNETVDRSDVVGASPVGVAPTTSSFST